MRYHLLGPLRAELSGRSIDLGPPKQRAVLAMLVLAGGAVVSVDRLIDGVWGDDPPANVTASLQAYISNLRKALRDEANVASPIVRRPPGYYLAIGEQDAVDLTDFETCCAQAREAVARSDWQAALRATEAAAGLRTGGLLDDLADHDWVATAAVRVEEFVNYFRYGYPTATTASRSTALAKPASIELPKAGTVELQTDSRQVELEKGQPIQVKMTGEGCALVVGYMLP